MKSCSSSLHRAGPFQEGFLLLWDPCVFLIAVRRAVVTSSPVCVPCPVPPWGWGGKALLCPFALSLAWILPVAVTRGTLGTVCAAPLRLPGWRAQHPNKANAARHGLGKVLALLNQTCQTRRWAKLQGDLFVAFGVVRRARNADAGCVGGWRWGGSGVGCRLCGRGRVLSTQEQQCNVAGAGFAACF